jgi:hypothetical protein
MKARTISLSHLTTWLGSVALIIALGAFAQTTAAARLAAQVNREGPVQVQVTPRSLAAGAKVWEFDVAFNTHTTPVEGDPAQFYVHKALAWNGDPPGGHHRKGVLQFKPVAGATEIELRINGVGGIATRSFRWQL